MTLSTRALVGGLAAAAVLVGRARGQPPPSGPPESPRVAITNVTVIDGTGREPAAGMTVAVDRGRISWVGRSSQRPGRADERVIDGRGKFLLPGLIDTHAHFTYIEWPSDPADDAVGRVRDDVTTESLRLLLQFGVTTIRNPAGPTSAAVGYRNRVTAGEIEGPAVFTAGDILNRAPRYDGLTRPVATAADVEREVAAQAAARVDFVKLYAGLPPALVQAAIRSAHAHGLRVVGHLQATSWTEAAGMGIDAISHGASWSAAELAPDRRDAYERAVSSKGAMRARLDWLDRVAPDGPQIERMISEVSRRRIPVDPTLIAYATKFQARDARFVHSPDLSLAPPAMRSSFPLLSFVRDWSQADFDHGRRAWPKMQALVRAYHRGGVLLTAGSDEPNSWIVPGAGLHTELELLVEAGLPPLDVLRIATRNGAESLGILKDAGTIEAGKRADLLLLDQDPTQDIRHTRSISLVMKGGRVVR